MDEKYRELLPYREQYPPPESFEAAVAYVERCKAMGGDAYINERGRVAVMWNSLVVPIRAFVTDPDGEKGKLYKACDRTGSCATIGDHRRSHIRGTFPYDGDQWVNTSSFTSGGALCHRVVPLAEYVGPVPAFERDRGPAPLWSTGYTGHIVQWRKQPHVLAGERLIVYSYPPGAPNYPVPDPSDDRTVALEGALVELGRHAVLESEEAITKLAQVLGVVVEEQRRDVLRANRCPLVFEAGGRLWLADGHLSTRSGDAGVWTTRQLVELVRPEGLPPHIAPIRYPAGRGYGPDTGRIVNHLGQELAISDVKLYVGTFTPAAPLSADERFAQAQRNLARQAANAAPLASTGKKAAPSKPKRQEPDQGPMEQLSFLA
jgi:hypothetical protein